MLATMARGDFQDPSRLLAAAEAGMAGIPNERLFVDADARYRGLFEQWCAGSLGVAYHLFVTRCEVAMHSESDEADFSVRKHGTTAPIFPFQTVEVMEPGRRRSEEYRNPRPRPYRPGQGTIEGPAWIASAVHKKLRKHYAGANQLNILVYVNFSAQGLEFAQISECLDRFRGAFASVWVMAHHIVGTVFSTPELGSIEGWRLLRGPAD
jgi:hypothetical protein